MVRLVTSQSRKGSKPPVALLKKRNGGSAGRCSQGGKARRKEFHSGRLRPSSGDAQDCIALTLHLRDPHRVASLALQPPRAEPGSGLVEAGGWSALSIRAHWRHDWTSSSPLEPGAQGPARSALSSAVRRVDAAPVLVGRPNLGASHEGHVQPSQRRGPRQAQPGSVGHRQRAAQPQAAPRRRLGERRPRGPPARAPAGAHHSAVRTHGRGPVGVPGGAVLLHRGGRAASDAQHPRRGGRGDAAAVGALLTRADLEV